MSSFQFKIAKEGKKGGTLRKEFLINSLAGLERSVSNSFLLSLANLIRSFFNYKFAREKRIRFGVALGPRGRPGKAFVAEIRLATASA